MPEEIIAQTQPPADNSGQEVVAKEVTPADPAKTAGDVTPPSSYKAKVEDKGEKQVADKKSPLDVLAEDEGEDVEGDWPTDWREKYSGEDAKLLARLQRFPSPKAMMDSYFQLEKKLSSGEHKKAGLPEGATEKEIADYRKANGIPEKPYDYKVELKDGFVIGTDDKPLVDKFLESMHGKNASPEIVNAALQTYYELMTEQESARKQEFEEFSQQGIKELREEYGTDYKRNVNVVQNFINNQFGDEADVLSFAVGGNGLPLMSNPAIVRKLFALATEIDPVSTISPGAGTSGAQGMNDRIAEIERYMGSNRNAYYKNEGMQKEYGELLGARERLASRK